MLNWKGSQGDTRAAPWAATDGREFLTLRNKPSHWLTLACVLIAALLAAGTAMARPAKRAASHQRQHAHRQAHALGERAAAIARHMIGVPYRWGGSSPAGFDCSGLVAFAYGWLGLRLPHSSYELYRLGRRVGRWALLPGDLVFFDGAGHVGLYLGRGRFVAATHSGDHVRISSLREAWYASTYVGARRLATGSRSA